MVLSPLTSKGGFTTKTVKTRQKQNFFYQRVAVRWQRTATRFYSTKNDKKSYSAVLKRGQFKQVQIIWNEVRIASWLAPRFLFDIFLQSSTDWYHHLNYKTPLSGIPHCRSPPLLKSGFPKFQKWRISYGLSICSGESKV